MVFELLIIGVTVSSITAASLRFAREMDPAQRRREAFAEKRRILERERASWVNSLHAKTPMAQRKAISEEIAEIDRQLKALADEEIRGT